MLGSVPNMFNGIVVRSIWWHGNEVNPFQDAAFGQLFSYCLAFVKGGVVPDDADLLVRVYFEKLFGRIEHFFTVLPSHLVEMALETLLVEEANVALGLFLAINLDDGPLAFLKPAFSDDSFLIHTDFVTGEDLPGFVC